MGLLAATGAVNAIGKDGKCRILSLRGGGIHGAWEAGVLKGMLENMPDGSMEYDYISGVSVGALAASVFATFPKGEEKEAIETITDLYAGRATKDLFEMYKPAIIAPWRHDSMTSNKNMVDLLAETLGDKPFVRCLSFLSCDLANGQVVVFDE